MVVKRNAVTAMAQFDQRLVIEAEKRAFQHACKRQIVLGQHHDAAERHQILDRDVFGQFQPVGTGDIEPGLLQFPDDRRHEAVAPSHQDQDVAMPDRPVVARQLVAMVDPRPDGRGDTLGQQHGRIARLLGVDGRQPLGLFRARRLRQDRPDAHLARIIGPDRVMHRAAGGISTQPARVVGVFEDAVDRTQNVRRRTKRQMQPDMLEPDTRCLRVPG